MKISLNSLFQFMQRSKKTILLIIIASAATLLISTAVSIWLYRFHNLRFPSLGTLRVVEVEAYGGNITTQDGNQILDWGKVYPGTLINCSFYIKSISNVPVILSLNFSNLTFQNSSEKPVTAPLPIASPMNLTWDYDNRLLYLNDTIYVTLTLETTSDPRFVEYIINNDVKKFSFDIIIRPVER